MPARKYRLEPEPDPKNRGPWEELGAMVRSNGYQELVENPNEVQKAVHK